MTATYSMMVEKTNRLKKLGWYPGTIYYRADLVVMLAAKTIPLMIIS